MAIKYEIHYLPNAGGEGETRRFAHVFEEPAMTDNQWWNDLPNIVALAKRKLPAC